MQHDHGRPRGKTALVTGGASGIGLATVELLARCGARVAVNHLAEDPRAAQEIARLESEGRAVIDAPGDVSQPEDCQRMVLEAIDRLGRLDILVNNAATPGTSKPIDFKDLDAMSEEFWNSIVSTNLIGPFRCTRAAAEALRAARGAVVNTASIAGLNTQGSSIAYGAAKAGLINMTRSLARALAPEVRVNAVAPGLVDFRGRPLGRPNSRLRWSRRRRSAACAHPPTSPRGSSSSRREVRW